MSQLLPNSPLHFCLSSHIVLCGNELVWTTLNKLSKATP